MKQTKVLYFFDTLCGWCFGFGPVIERAHGEYKDIFAFDIISGGLKLGEDVGPIGIVAPYIKAGAYKQVEERTGVTFGDDFIRGPLEEGTLVLNSLTPAIAMAIVKAQAPTKAFTFGHLLHRALYVDGTDLGKVDQYGRYAQKIGLEAKNFVRDLEDPVYEELAQRDFQLAKSYGIRGFPAVVAQRNERAVLLSNGYVDYPTLRQKLEALKQWN